MCVRIDTVWRFALAGDQAENGKRKASVKHRVSVSKLDPRHLISDGWSGRFPSTRIQTSRSRPLSEAGCDYCFAACNLAVRDNAVTWEDNCKTETLGIHEQPLVCLVLREMTFPRCVFPRGQLRSAICRLVSNRLFCKKKKKKVKWEEKRAFCLCQCAHAEQRLEALG